MNTMNRLMFKNVTVGWIAQVTGMAMLAALMPLGGNRITFPDFRIFLPSAPAVALPPALPVVVKPVARQAQGAVAAHRKFPALYPIRANLHPYGREYTFVFTGKVTCADLPCREANVRVHVQTSQNPVVERQAPIRPDGSYSVTFSLKEIPDQPADWKIIAYSPESQTQVLQGRSILMGDATLTIEEPIHLL